MIFISADDHCPPLEKDAHQDPHDLEAAFRRVIPASPPDCIFMARYERDRAEAANLLGHKTTRTNHGAEIPLH